MKKKRKKYDKLGHEAYEKGFEPGKESEKRHYPNWQEVYEEAFSTETVADRYIGSQGYPDVYVGQYVENPESGDIYYSAQDIRIAKMERAAHRLEKIIEEFEEARDVGDWDRDRVKLVEGMIEDLYDAGWLNKEEHNKFKEVVVKYIEKLPELETVKKEENIRDRIEEEYGLLQEKDEVRRSRREIKDLEEIGYSKEDRVHGHRKGFDPDQRKQWRKEKEEEKNFERPISKK